MSSLPTKPAPEATKWFGAFSVLLLLATLIFALFVRHRLLEMPLDRDEGEYACIAQQLLQGVPPYESGYSLKMPGIFAAYALGFLAFGESIRSVHLTGAFANLVSTVMLLGITWRLFDFSTACLAGSFYLLLTLDPAVHGIMAQSEQFVLVFTLAGLLLLITPKAAFPTQPHRWLAHLFAGVCLGSAIMVKQHAAAYLLLAPVVIAQQWWVHKPMVRATVLMVRLVVFALGVVIPALLVAWWMRAAGVWDDFIFWTIVYAREYATSVDAWTGIQLFARVFSQILSSFPLIWLLAGIGLASLFVHEKTRTNRFFLIALFVASSVALSLGLYFRDHYFLFWSPPAAIFAALGCEWAAKSLAPILDPSGWLKPTLLAGLVMLVVLPVSIGNRRHLLLDASHAEISRALFTTNPFPESVEIAKEIKKRSAASEEKVFVFGSEPQIYFYLAQRPVSPHIYMYPLMENHPYAKRMQEELASDVEKQRPEWIVIVNGYGSWMDRPDSIRWIFEWMKPIVREEYEKVGVIDIEPEKTTYVWDDPARTYEPRSSHVEVYRRTSQTK